MATVVQKEGHLSLSVDRVKTPPMTSPQVDNIVSEKTERVSIVRFALWAAVFLALILGLVLFFRYTKLMTPLL